MIFRPYAPVHAGFDSRNRFADAAESSVELEVDLSAKHLGVQTFETAGVRSAVCILRVWGGARSKL